MESLSANYRNPHSALATESERLRALLEQFKLADQAQQGANRDGYMRMAG